MKAKLFLLGIIGAVAYGASRLVKAPAGAVRSGTSKAAGALRDRGPDVLENVAHGIEKAGDVTEKGAQTIRERMATDEGAEPSAGQAPGDAQSTGASSTDDLR